MQQSITQVNHGYEYYKNIFTGKRFPLAFVDLDLLNQNAQLIRERAGKLPVRIASKSIRSKYLIKYLLDFDPGFSGVMSFSAEEAVYLSKNGIDDILVAYPDSNLKGLKDIAGEIKSGKYICLMVDDPIQLKQIEQIGKALNTIFPICIDIDVSVDFPGLHFGVWRSPIRSAEPLEKLLSAIKKSEFVELHGIMGYESQIAGVTDHVPGQAIMNKVKRLLKLLSYKKIAQKRQKAATIINNAGFNLKFVNGGGTGSIESTAKDHAVTELTVGSGFYNAHLFDNYKKFRLLPAAGFACVINRIPTKGVYTCSGGGYIASGAIEKLKAPLPTLPKGVKLTTNEGAGEVQTPILYSGKHKLDIGDPVFFRHAKAGELCERFHEIHLIKEGKIEKVVSTYRGDGFCFL